MELREFIADCVSTTYNRLTAAGKGLTTTQLSWQPTPDAAHAGYLLFNAFRLYDLAFHRLLSPQGELWVRNKWGRHFTLPPEPEDAGPYWSTGQGWTPQEIAAFQVPPIDELLAYGESVYQSGMRRLSVLDFSKWNQPVGFHKEQLTQGDVLKRLCTDVPRIAGQVEYVVQLTRQQSLQQTP